MKKELVKKSKNLPATMDELIAISVLGKGQIKELEKRIKLLSTMKAAEDQLNKTKEDAFEIGVYVLRCSVRMGELLPDTDVRVQKKDTAGKFQEKLPKGIDRRRAHQLRKLAKHSDCVEAAIEWADENDEVPREGNVHWRIHEKEQERKKHLKKVLGPKMRRYDKYGPMQGEFVYKLLSANYSLSHLKYSLEWDAEVFVEAKKVCKSIMGKLKPIMEAKEHKVIDVGEDPRQLKLIGVTGGEGK